MIIKSTSLESSIIIVLIEAILRVKRVKFLTPSFDESFPCPTTVLEVFRRGLGMIASTEKSDSDKSLNKWTCLIKKLNILT